MCVDVNQLKMLVLILIQQPILPVYHLEHPFYVCTIIHVQYHWTFRAFSPSPGSSWKSYQIQTALNGKMGEDAKEIVQRVLPKEVHSVADSYTGDLLNLAIDLANRLVSSVSKMNEIMTTWLSLADDYYTFFPILLLFVWGAMCRSQNSLFARSRPSRRRQEFHTRMSTWKRDSCGTSGMTNVLLVQRLWR